MTYYHYCSTEAFRTILTKKTIWLSSLTSSNDELEGKWITRTIEKVARDEGLSPLQCALLRQMAEAVDDSFDCLGFCLSSDGDMLSQWRGYADDGRGVSIGFNEEFLAAFAAANEWTSFQQTVYDEGIQKQIVREKFPRIRELIAKGALTPPTPGTVLTPKSYDELSIENANYAINSKRLFGVITELQPLWFTFKNPAFKEENEWRIAMTVLQSHKTDYRTAKGRLVPYRELNFSDFISGRVIDQVILGPKNTTPLRVARSFLESTDFPATILLTSEASYR